jgi:hypothetical protein
VNGAGATAPPASPSDPDGIGGAAGEAADAGGLRTRPVGLAAGPVPFALVLAWPLPDLTREAHAPAAVFVWAAVYWVTLAAVGRKNSIHRPFLLPGRVKDSRQVEDGRGAA